MAAASELDFHYLQVLSTSTSVQPELGNFRIIAIERAPSAMPPALTLAEPTRNAYLSTVVLFMVRPAFPSAIERRTAPRSMRRYDPPSLISGDESRLCEGLK